VPELAKRPPEQYAATFPFTGSPSVGFEGRTADFSTIDEKKVSNLLGQFNQGEFFQSQTLSVSSTNCNAQSVGILLGAAPPWAVRVGKADLHAVRPVRILFIHSKDSNIIESGKTGHFPARYTRKRNVEYYRKLRSDLKNGKFKDR
jgi:hypothetical protein